MIEKMTMSSSERLEVHNSYVPCAQYITLDYEDKALFWADHCTHRIEHSSMNGDTQTVVAESVYFSYELIVSKDIIYWTQLNPTGVF